MIATEIGTARMSVRVPELLGIEFSCLVGSGKGKEGQEGAF